MVSARTRVGKTKSAKAKRKEPGLKEIWTEVCHSQKGLLMAMLILGAMSVILLLFSLTTLRPQNTVVIVGYGDVYGTITGINAGYRRDAWMSMMAFPILALVIGVIHNVIALKMYQKYGKDLALTFVVGSMILIVGVVIVLLRLMGEW